MAIGDLTSYERRREWYSNIQLGRDVKTQTELLKNQARAMISAQAASTSAIIASQESIREGLDNISYGIEEVRDGIYGLKAAFEFGISEVVWQIEQNRQVLKDILETLMAPLDTQAKELRRRAEDAYANGWHEDALADFLESESKNKYDFTVQISIGLLYLFHFVDRDKALEYFQKATKYAKPKSPYHASFALLHTALIKRDLSQLADAEKLTAEAVELTPDFSEALYQNAQYNAQLRNTHKSLGALEKAVKLDRNYCIKADNDEMFDPVRAEVTKLFERLRDELRAVCISSCDKMEKALAKLAVFISGNQSVLSGLSENPASLSNNATQIKRLLERNSYFDCLDAQPLVTAYVDGGKRIIQNTGKHLSDYFKKKIGALESSIKSAPAVSQRQGEERREKIGGSGGLGCLTWAVLFFGWVFGGLYLGIDDRKGVTPGMFFWVVGNLTFLFGGFFIARGINTLLATMMVQNKDVSGVIKGNQNEIDALEAYRNKVEAEFGTIAGSV